MRASKLRLPESTAAQTRSLLGDRLVELGREVAGVADAGRAAVGGDAEAELLEVGQQARLRQVLGDDARARRERGLDVRLDRQARLDRLLREQAGGEQHARVRRVRARRDRGDQHVAVADVDGWRGLDAIGRRPVVDHLDDVARLAVAGTLASSRRPRRLPRRSRARELVGRLREAVLGDRLAEELGERALEAAELDAVLRALRARDATP